VGDHRAFFLFVVSMIFCPGPPMPASPGGGNSPFPFKVIRNSGPCRDLGATLFLATITENLPPSWRRRPCRSTKPHIRVCGGQGGTEIPHGGFLKFYWWCRIICQIFLPGQNISMGLSQRNKHVPPVRVVYRPLVAIGRFGF